LAASLEGNKDEEKLGDKFDQMKDEMVNLGGRLQSGESDEKGLL